VLGLTAVVVVIEEDAAVVVEGCVTLVSSFRTAHLFA